MQAIGKASAPLFLVVLLSVSLASAEDRAAPNFRDCVRCHEGIEQLDDRHGFECGACHLREEDRALGTLPSHDVVVRNPSAPEFVKLFCGRCHGKDIEHLETSLHGTLAGMINQTRFLWGAQAQADPPLYGMSGPLARLPDPEENPAPPSDPAQLVDDFLRRRCLSCHVYTKGVSDRGWYRSTGCAACHVPYDVSGRYLGEDRALDRSRSGYPSRHVFERPPGNERCLRCHRRNHVGADYEGLFELDVSSVYRPFALSTPLPAGAAEPGYHRLARDVHAQSGLLCVDCHTRENVMGNGALYALQLKSPGPACTDCHGGWGREGPSAGLPGIEAAETGYLFQSKAGGEPRWLPLFQESVPAHDSRMHSRLRCSACHAQWSFQDYGLSVIRLDLLKGVEWLELTAQGDPAIQAVLTRHVSGNGVATTPSSRDWVKEKDRPGVWLAGWRFRRWEWLPLGVDHEGWFSIVRPLYQYLVSYVDRNGEVLLDSVVPERGDGSGDGWAFMPYVPHTIGPLGRNCDACHRNRMAAGLGLSESLTDDTRLTVVSPPVVEGMRRLDDSEKQRLLEPSAEWGSIRIRALRGEWRLEGRLDTEHP